MLDSPRPNSSTEPDAPAAVNRLLNEAHRAGASDIHLQSVPGAVEVRWRLDGVLQDRPAIPHPHGERLLGRIKYLARLKTYQESIPQDGRIAAADVQLPEDVRVATYPTLTGEKIVLRLFGSRTAQRLAELGLPLPALQSLQTALLQPTGLILFTGPAGSGKSTTVQACLRELVAAGGGRHIVTVEDPVEQQIPGVMQTEVNETRGLGYPAAVRHLLRQDPQVLVLGEIRDDETASLAVRAALTGHLVISTLHAGSCQGVLERLRLMVPDPFAVAAALSLVVNQRLVRRLCSPCSGNGCSHCHHTGFNGRIPIVEQIPITPTNRPILRAGDIASFHPDPTLASAARHLVDAGLTLPNEILRILGS
jgi:general secretion pathway protein E